MKSFYILKLTFYLVSFLAFLLNIVERIFVFLFNKPIFIHTYLVKKRLPRHKKEFLETSVKFYQNLTDKQKPYFEHRLVKFLRNYSFISRDGFNITPEVKILIASSYIKLTFGMRKYLTSTFNKIIIYPTSYYSLVTKQYHKGEFNPGLKLIIFSWEDFLLGEVILNDNLNLGIHEFTHALTFHGKQSKDVSARIFYRTYLEIIKFMKNPDNSERVIKSGYFRDYANTNALEFVSVIMEHFFETPEDLKQKFPRLYFKVETMLNYKTVI
ncbi:zinc-dependent peptidase [Tenacibaculum jejuense]|uniref:Zinc-dependent peptidase n=1 Tax=Tenacibaculum jejuense TaxID=584609 RepID=A0A238U8N3_9FLAO|nr:zinc-dependent peptidase [Tenacibaculum jejuense]SNR14770.1 Probable transmembrane protein of unknown function [Tenacibaculum jejuense]